MMAKGGVTLVEAQGPLEARDGSVPHAPPPVPLLLADDNEMTRASLAYILGRAGFAVEGARDGMEAVALAQTGRFRVILMDVHMPNLDGLAAAAMIRRRPALRGTPIVMVSSQASPESVRACRQVGAIDFVVKQGFNPEVLIAKLQKVLAPLAGTLGVMGGSAMATGRKGGNADGAEGIEDEAAGLTPEVWREKMAVIGAMDPEAALAALEGIDLPLLVPSLVHEVQQVDTGAGSDTDHLVRLIEQDAAVAVAVLRAAAAGPRAADEAACDVASAVGPLGPGGVTRVLDRWPSQALPLPEDPAVAWLRRGWRHALAVSLIAGELAEGSGVRPGVARAAGLLHEVGRGLILASALGPRAVACYELAAHLPFPTVMAEQMLLGLNSKRVGEQYCRRLGLAAALAGTCVWHDMDGRQRQRLTPPEASLGAVVGAADQIAKAAGFASLKNDDLWPLPGPVPGEAAVAPRIAAAIEEVENIALFRLGPAARVERCLAGVTVAFLSPGPGRLNPYQIALTGAGARVHAGRQLSDLIRGPAPDLVVLDGMTQPGSGVRAELKRLGQVVDLGLVPKLLLARRSDDPAGVVGRSDPAVSVLLSPLRLGTFLRVARRLAEE